MRSIRFTYSLSIMNPSTLCKSFEAHPAGLKVKTALNPLLWLTTSIVPYCSIHSLPTMMLCTQQLTFVHVYASFHLLTNIFSVLAWDRLPLDSKWKCTLEVRRWRHPSVEFQRFYPRTLASDEWSREIQNWANLHGMQILEDDEIPEMTTRTDIPHIVAIHPIHLSYLFTQNSEFRPIQFECLTQ